MDLIHNNYIRTYGSGKDFTIDIDLLPYTSNNYYQESILAAQMVESTKQGQLYIMYSGGVDSEYALSVFLSQGIKITPVIVRLNPLYNAHDIKYAFEFCSEKGIEPLVIDIDYDHFIKSGKMLDLAKDMSSSVPHYTTTAYAISQLNGTVVCGDGEPHLSKNTTTNEWTINIYQFEYSLTNLYSKHGINGVVHFNRYTPQMMRTYLMDPRMVDLANNRVPGKLGSHSSKWLIYNRHSNFNLKERPKFHGFEKIENSEIHEHESFKELATIGQQWDAIWAMEYFQLVDEVCNFTLQKG
jgi:hypothetical protein